MTEDSAPTLDPQRHALFLDVDGTVVDIAPDPDAVVVADGLPDLLAQWHGALGGALAVLSGRPIRDVDWLFAPFAGPASGVHGAEFRLPGQRAVTQCAAPLPAPLTSLIEQLQAWPGVRIETKGVAVAVHVRQAGVGVAADVERRLAALIAAEGDRLGLTVLAGKAVFEVKPRALTKGTAVDRLMAEHPFRGRLPVVVGDDVTDQAAFAAATRHGGIAIAVGCWRPGAHYLIASPDGVRAWLRQGLPTASLTT